MLGEKGAAVVRAFCEHLPDPEGTLAVVIGRDAAVADDHGDAIRAAAERAGVTHSSQRAAAQRALPPPDVVVAAGWRHLIYTTAQLIVLHDSPLPRYRGFAPLVNMLINGEPELAATALYAVRDYDAGDVIATRTAPVAYPLRIAEAITLVARLYYELAADLAGRLLAAGGQRLPATPQDHAAATYSIWRDREDYRLDLALDAERLARTVDALGYPYAHARLRLDGTEVAVRAAEALPHIRHEVPAVGKVMFATPDSCTVACGAGALRITEAQYLAGPRAGASIFPLEGFRKRFA